MALPARTDLLRSQRRSTVARALAFAVALLFLLVSLSAEAKKKKGGKKHKTPAAKTKGNSTEALPAASEESDEASSDEKPSSKPAVESEPEEKPPAPPPEEEAAPARKPKPVKMEKEEGEGGGGGGPLAFRVGIGGGALFRNLTWTGSSGMLPPYSLSPGPEAALWLETFPAAFATDGFAANIGLYARFNLGFGAASRTPAGEMLTTKYQDFLVGLKVRIPLGSFQPYVLGAYGMQKFSLTDPMDVTRPNFNYAFLDLGGGARIEFTPTVDLDVRAGYVLVMNPGSAAGDVANAMLYPDTKAYGVDVSLSLGFRVTGMIGVRAGFDFRQYGVNVQGMRGPMAVPAAGAADRYITAWGGLELIFDGVGGGGGGGEEAPPPKKAKAKAKKAAADEEGGDPEVTPDKDKEKDKDADE